ncbi:unnamed protein product [Boreogadus saida]
MTETVSDPISILSHLDEQNSQNTKEREAILRQREPSTPVALVVTQGLKCTVPTESCLHGGRCEAFSNGNGECNTTGAPELSVAPYSTTGAPELSVAPYSTTGPLSSVWPLIAPPGP